MRTVVHEITRHLHLTLQNLFLLLQLPFQPLVNYLFRLQGVQRFFVIRAPNTGSFSNQEFFDTVATMFEDAIEIKIALSELENTLIDNLAVLGALEEAKRRNNAEIEIIHSRKTDPKTRKIYALAQRQILRMFMMPHYERRSYILTKGPSGSYRVLDVGVHNEALWIQDDKGLPLQLYTSRYRTYFFVDNSFRLAVRLLNDFEHRRSISIPTPVDGRRRLDYETHYTYPILRTIITGFRNIPFRWLVQPLQVLLDKPIGKLNDEVRNSVLKHSMHSKPEQPVFDSGVVGATIQSRPIFALLNEASDNRGFLSSVEDLYTSLYAYLMLYAPDQEYMNIVGTDTEEEIDASIEETLDEIEEQYRTQLNHEVTWIKKQIAKKKYATAIAYFVLVNTYIEEEFATSAPPPEADHINDGEFDTKVTNH